MGEEPMIIFLENPQSSNGIQSALWTADKGSISFIRYSFIQMSDVYRTPTI